MKATISVNDLERLEFSTWGADPETFGSPLEILDDLESWSSHLEFGQTGLEYLNWGKSYCYGIHSSDCGVVLCLWHESPTVDGNTLFADMSDSVGDVDVSAVPVPHGVIPGVPAYYWFTPSFRHVCGIRFPDLPASRSKLRNYLKAFMMNACELGNFTQYVDDQTARVISLQLPEPDGRAVRAVVEMSTGKRTDLGDLRQERRDIRKIERKDKFTEEGEELNSLWKNAFGYEEDAHPHATQVHRTFDVPKGISGPFFDQIVEFYQECDPEELDIGFHKTGGRIQWLSARRLVSTHDLNVTEQNHMVRDLDQLADELDVRRKRILGGKAT